MYLNGGFVFGVSQQVAVAVALRGSFAYDAAVAAVTLSDSRGTVPPMFLPVGPSLVRLAGELTFDFAATASPSAVG